MVRPRRRSRSGSLPGDPPEVGGSTVDMGPPIGTTPGRRDDAVRRTRVFLQLRQWCCARGEGERGESHLIQARSRFVSAVPL